MTTEEEEEHNVNISALQETAGSDEEAGEQQQKRRRKRKRSRKKGDENEEARASDVVQDESSAHEKEQDELQRTVFVEGIPYTGTESDLRQFFRDKASLEVVECRLPTWQDSGRLRGYGHVVFETAEDQKAALQKCDKQYMGSRYLSIQPAKPPSQGSGATDNPSSDPSKTILLKNLSYQATEDDIYEVMSKFGKIARGEGGGVRVVRNHQTQQSKGFAYVEFEELNSAQKVMESATAISIMGRPCRVDYDHGRMKGSFRAPNGRYWNKEYGSLGNKVQKH